MANVQPAFHEKQLGYQARLIGAVAICLGIATAQAANPVIYSQPENPALDLYASQNDPSGFGNFATTYDNFSFASGARVTDVHWSGGYFNPPSQGQITQFQLQIWSDNAGQPGASLYSEAFAGNAGEANFHLCGLGFPCFDYGVDLSIPFVALPGTPYWLSVVADMAFPPQWGWAGGSGGDGIFYQDFFGARTALQGDRAFELTGCLPGNERCGRQVPEPLTLALLGMGLAGIGLARRRSSR